MKCELCQQEMSVMEQEVFGENCFNCEQELEENFQKYLDEEISNEEFAKRSKQRGLRNE